MCFFIVVEVSLRTLGWPGSHYVDQAALEFIRDPSTCLCLLSAAVKGVSPFSTWGQNIPEYIPFCSASGIDRSDICSMVIDALAVEKLKFLRPYDQRGSW